MEKSEGNIPKEQDDQDLHIRDPDIYKEKVESDHLQSIRQLQRNGDPTQNLQEQDFLERTEENEVCTEGQKQGMDVKHKVERSTDDFLVRTKDLIPTFKLETVEVKQEYIELSKDEAGNFFARKKDSIPTIKLEAVAVNQEYVEFAKDEMLDQKSNIAVETRTEYIEEILPVLEKDSIPDPGYDLNDAAQEEEDRIAKLDHLEANKALKQSKDQQRNLSILSSKKEGSQQTCEVSEKVKGEQDIITQQEIETKHKLSETRTEAREAQYDARDHEIQREKELEKMMTSFFNNQNQVKVQERTDNQKEILFSPVQDKIETVECFNNEYQDVVQQRGTNPKQILNAPAEYSIPTVEHNSKDADETGTPYRNWREEARNSVRKYFNERYPHILQQTAKSASAPDSIPRIEHESSNHEGPNIDRTERSETNTTFQERNDQLKSHSTLSTIICLQQPCKESKENVKVQKEQGIVMKQKSAVVDVSNSPAEADAQNQKLIQREKELRGKGLAESCNKKNQGTVRQREGIPKQSLNALGKDSIPTVQNDSIDSAHQDLEKKECLKTNETLQQRSDQSRKLSTLSSEKDLQQPCEVTEETLKMRKPNLLIVQKSAAPCSDPITQAKSDTQNQKLMQREEELKNVLANFFSRTNANNQPKAEIYHQTAVSIENFEDVQLQKPNQITYRELEETGKEREQKQVEHLPECLSKSEDRLLARSKEPKEDTNVCHPETKEDKSIEIRPQSNTHSINNSEDVESHKPKQTITYRELQELREKWRRAHGDASVEEVLARSRISKENTTEDQPEPIEGKKLECSKDFNPHKPELDDIATRFQKINYHSSELGRGTVRPQKTKDYVTLPFREPSETAASLKTKDYVTSRTRRSENETEFTCRKSIETTPSSKTKDYVTLRPRRSDNETAWTKISKGVSSTSKDYITTHINEQNRTISDHQPPNHTFWPVQENTSSPGSSTHTTTHPIGQNTTPTDPQTPNHAFWSVPENASSPGLSTEMLVPPLSGQKPVTSPKSNLPLGKQQQEEEASLPNRMSPSQDQTSPIYRRRRVLENDDVSLLFNEDFPEVTVVTDETGAQINRTSSAGIWSFLPPIHDHFEPSESPTSDRTLSKDRILRHGLCGILFLLIIMALIIVGIIVYYSISPTAVSPLYKFKRNMNTSVISVKNYHQSESLDGEVGITTTHLDVTESEFHDIFSGMDGKTTPLIQSSNDNADTNEINSESNMATLVTNLDNKLIDSEFGVTSPINDFDVNIITHVTDWELNAINPITYLDNIMNPLSCLENVITPVTDLGNNNVNPVTEVENVITPVTGLENDINPDTDVSNVTNLDLSVINVTYSKLYNYLRGRFEH